MVPLTHVLQISHSVVIPQIIVWRKLPVRSDRRGSIFLLHLWSKLLFLFLMFPSIYPTSTWICFSSVLCLFLGELIHCKDSTSNTTLIICDFISKAIYILLSSSWQTPFTWLVEPENWGLLSCCLCPSPSNALPLNPVSNLCHFCPGCQQSPPVVPMLLPLLPYNPPFSQQSECSFRYVKWSYHFGFKTCNGLFCSGK